MSQLNKEKKDKESSREINNLVLLIKILGNIGKGNKS